MHRQAYVCKGEEEEATKAQDEREYITYLGQKRRQGNSRQVGRQVKNKSAECRLQREEKEATKRGAVR